MAKCVFVSVCDVRHLDKRIYKQCSGIYQEWQGRQRARVPPPPFGAERRLGYPQATFFYFSKQFFFLLFFLNAPIYPFSFPLRGFLFLCVYFPIRVSFRVSEGKKRGNKNCFSCPTYVCLVIIRSILILCYFPMLCFSAVSPYCFSLSALCSCIVFCCGCCVFR